MSKYDTLKQFLLSLEESSIKLSFSEIEEILGCKLPPSANLYPAWWSNDKHHHPHAQAWMKAGFLTKDVDFEKKTVVFYKSKNASLAMHQPYNHQKSTQKLNVQRSWPPVKEHSYTGSPVFSKQDNNILNVCGYEFRFIQQLIPECENGKVKEYAPQKEYPLNPNGAGTFCRFSICAPSVSGVYLWVAAGEIIYIGETVNLAQRFNVGYGYISPENCYAGGQSTNCKMNKVVMEYYKKGESIDLYFLQTKDYKQIELALLRQIHTKYNVKDN